MGLSGCNGGNPHAFMLCKNDSHGLSLGIIPSELLANEPQPANSQATVEGQLSVNRMFHIYCTIAHSPKMSNTFAYLFSAPRMSAAPPKKTELVLRSTYLPGPGSEVGEAVFHSVSVRKKSREAIPGSSRNGCLLAQYFMVWLLSSLDAIALSFQLRQCQRCQDTYCK